MSYIARQTLIQAATGTTDLTGKEGFFVKPSSGAVALVAAATDVPLGCVVDGQPTTGATAVALPGTIVRVKCDATAGTIALGTYLTVTSTGTVVADPGSGARVQVAVALESGANDALIIARLCEPKSIAA